MGNSNVVIIPALNPDEHLITLVTELQTLGQTSIVVIDDGSSADHQTIFHRLETMGCLVCRHITNLGKGEALKTGIRMTGEKISGVRGYITADADGQHQASDIIHVAATLDAHPESIILGVRDFSKNNVPRKSWFGNSVTSFLFHLTTGVRCRDTQTGLRGFSTALTEFALTTPGSRYEYEMNFLLEAAKRKFPFYSIPIETIYYDRNTASHFHPFTDSYRIYKTPLKFVATSLVCAAADLIIFTLMSNFLSTSTLERVLLATITARLFSGALNFFINRIWSFNTHQVWQGQAMRYGALFFSQMIASWLLVWTFSFLPLPLTATKAIVDTALFVVSYILQRDWVFRKR